MIRQNLRNFYNATIISIGFCSIIMLFIQLNFRLFDVCCDECGSYTTFEITLLQLYVFSTVSLGLYYLIYPLFIKNFFGKKKLSYAIMAIQTPVLWTLINTAFNYMHLQKINIRFFPIALIFAVASAAYIIIYFAENTHTKRMNKKLDEYKQQNDDDNNVG